MSILAAGGEAQNGRRAAVVLAACCLGLFMVGLDTTVVNIALPSIGGALHAPLAGLQWTAAAYTVATASLMMTAGGAADRAGHRAVFRAGLAVFTVASLLCGLAPSLGWLIAFRALQGAGGSVITPVSLAIITRAFPGPARRTRAIGLWSATFGLSMAAAPPLGGALIAVLGWRAVFWINVPAGIAALAAARLVPGSRPEGRRRADPAGQVLVIVMLASLALAIIGAPAAGWSSPRTAGCLACSAAALAGLLAWEPRHPDPLVDLRLFRSVPFTASCAVTAASFTCIGGFSLLAVLYLQDVRGMTALAAGVRLLPCAAGVLACSPLAGQVTARYGPRPAMVAAGAALTMACAALTRLTAGSPGLLLAVAFGAFGAGYGAVNSVVSAAAVAGLPPGTAGAAGGISAASRQAGQALGVAAAGALLAAGLRAPMRTGFIQAAFPAWCLMAACGYLVMILGVLATTRGALRSAEALAAALRSGRRAVPPGARRTLPLAVLAPARGRHARRDPRRPPPPPREDDGTGRPGWPPGETALARGG